MLKKIKIFLILTLGFVPLAFAGAPASVMAADVQSNAQCGADIAAGGDCSAPVSTPDIGDRIATILNILSAVAAVVAVVMLVIAGLRFITSGGNEGAVKGAKNSIIYAVIGIVVIAFAQVIVHFVISNVGAAASSGSTGQCVLEGGRGYHNSVTGDTCTP